MTTTNLPRKPLAAAVAILAIAWFGVAVFAATRVERLPGSEPAAGAEAAPPSLVKVDYRGCFILTSLLAAVAGITCASAAFFLVTRSDAAPPVAVEGSIRATKPVTIALLLAGFASGSMLMLIATRFFAEDFGTLSAWVTQGQTQGAWKVILALLGIVLGAGLTFAATIPARAEERNDQTLRRLVYGANAGISVLLVLIGLVLVNVIAAVRLPGKLDTTETGFYTLAPTTQDYIRNLSQKVTVHAYLEDGRISDDTRWLLTACQDLNPRMFSSNVRRLLSLSQKDYAEIREKYPQVDMQQREALIVTVGDEGSSDFRYSMIPAGELLKSANRPNEIPTFAGEGRLMKEVLFLSDNKTKPVVYFTQGSGEMLLQADPVQPNPRRTMSTLKAALEAANLAPKSLIWDDKAPKVPDDAAVVVVADPMNGMKPEYAAALKAYMLEGAAGKPKGKLILISGAHDSGGKFKLSGLEELLAEFNVSLLPKYLLCLQQQIPAEIAVGTVIDPTRTRNPVAMLLARSELYMPLARPIEPVRGGNPAFSVSPLLFTDGSSWMEDTRPVSIDAIIKAFGSNPQLMQQRRFSQQPRVLAASVSENSQTGSPVGRLYVYGSAEAFNDEMAQQLDKDFMAGRVLAASVDWLRDRPFVEVANKPYGVYKPKLEMDTGRVLMMPLGLTVLVLAAIGGTVWLVRRK